MKEVFENFTTLDVMKHEGVGNIVHPKQYFTIRGFDAIQKELFNARKHDIRIAYIGTDTTENIRSFLRWLSFRTIESVGVEVFTTDWDKDFLEYSLKQDIHHHHPNLSVHIENLVEEPSKPKRACKCDVVISTLIPMG